MTRKSLPPPANLWRPEWGKCPKLGKRRYPKRHDAQVDARRAGHLSAYKCQYCGDYHLTSQPRTLQKVYKLFNRKGDT